MAGGDENEENGGGYATRGAARTPKRNAPLADANVNELAPPNSAMADLQGR